MNYQEIIATKILIDEYNIESDAPCVKNAIGSNLKYTKIKNDEKKDNVKFSMEQIIISDIVFIKDWETYNISFNKFINKKGISPIQLNPTNYNDPYTIGSSIGYCSIRNNSKYSKYLSAISIDYFKINDHCYFVSIHLYLNNHIISVFDKIVNNNSMYYSKDSNYPGVVDNGDLFYCYVNIIKYEITKKLKEDGLIGFTDINYPIYSLCHCNIDLKKCHNFSFLGINVDLGKTNAKDILFNDKVMKTLFYWNLNIATNDYPTGRKTLRLSILLGYYNLYNILLGINDEQLKIIDGDLLGNKIDYEKIKSINNRYFLLSRVINNYKTSNFSSYSGLQFYNGEKQIQLEECVKEVYDSIKIAKNEFNNLYQGITKIYDINRIHDDSVKSKRMLKIGCVTLLVSFIAMLATIGQLVVSICNSNSQKMNEEIPIRKIVNNDSVMIIPSISEVSKIVVEDITLISSDSETRLNLIK